MQPPLLPTPEIDSLTSYVTTTVVGYSGDSGKENYVHRLVFHAI